MFLQPIVAILWIHRNPVRTSVSRLIKYVIDSESHEDTKYCSEIQPKNSTLLLLYSTAMVVDDMSVAVIIREENENVVLPTVKHRGYRTLRTIR